jgi:bifunctional non-homologous end joining protein LigD
MTTSTPALPTDVLAQQPMLASPAGQPPEVMLERLDQHLTYIWDVKWDGIRCLAYIDDGRVRLVSRRGVDITRRYPDVVANLVTALPAGKFVLDGELVVWNGERFDFSLALKRDSQTLTHKIEHLAERHPACYMAFDVLWANQDMRDETLANRLKALSRLLPASDLLGVQHSLSSTDGKVMWAAVEEFGFEGLVAKVAMSRYRSGRSTDWIKIKRLRRLTAIVTGYEPGEGGRSGRVGALFLALLDGDKLVPIGKVGTGFKRADHAPMLEVLRAGHQFLVEIEYMEATRDGILRHPSFKGVRADINRDDCTVAQIGR